MQRYSENFHKFVPYIIFGLALLLVCSIIINIYFYNLSQKRLFDCTLGEKIEVEFNEQDNIILANIVYPSNIVSGTKYKQLVVLKTGNLRANYYVRAKVIYADYNIVNESINVEVTPSIYWTKKDDGYYYLSAPISSYTEVEFINELTLPVLDTQLKNNTIITILFELIDTNLNVEDLWTT